MLHLTSRLPYVEALLLESQRFQHVVPTAGPRRTMRDTTLGGYNIPKVSWSYKDSFSLFNKPFLSILSPSFVEDYKSYVNRMTHFRDGFPMQELCDGLFLFKQQTKVLNTLRDINHVHSTFPTKLKMAEFAKRWQTLNFQDTIILMSLRSIHYDKERWADYEVFRPERFLTESGEMIPDEGLCPFGLGRFRVPLCTVNSYLSSKYHCH